MGTEASQEQLEAGRGYEALFVPALFEPWSPHLIDGAGVEAGAHVLDIACGSGVLARHALEKVGASGRVVGLDPAPGMLAAAYETEPAIDWIEGGAESLPFGDGAFDCLVSQFGMMFFTDKSAAAKEMRRVLKPGGRAAVAVWNALDHNPAYSDVIAVLDQHIGVEAGDALRLPYSLGDVSAVVSLLKDAGFEGVASATREEQARFPSSRTMVEAELRGWLPLFGINLSEQQISDVVAKSNATLSKYADSSGAAVFQTSAHIVTARAPS